MYVSDFLAPYTSIYSWDQLNERNKMSDLMFVSHVLAPHTFDMPLVHTTYSLLLQHVLASSSSLPYVTNVLWQTRCPTFHVCVHFHNMILYEIFPLSLFPATWCLKMFLASAKAALLFHADNQGRRESLCQNDASQILTSRPHQGRTTHSGLLNSTNFDGHPKQTKISFSSREQRQQ